VAVLIADWHKAAQDGSRMPYVREWEALYVALQRLKAAGQDEDQAMRDICGAIADRAIPVRVHCMKGFVYSDSNVVIPPLLAPSDLCWPSSRPRRPWKRRATVGDYYYDNDLRITVNLLELLREAVDQVLVRDVAPSNEAAETDAGGITPPPWLAPAQPGVARHRPAVPEPVGQRAPMLDPPDTPELRKASEARIHRTIEEVYDYAKSQGMKPPNVTEIGKPVQTRLRREGLAATETHIEKLAGDERHKSRRLPAGSRVYGSLLPFSDPEM
jgi:hypothetical protein